MFAQKCSFVLNDACLLTEICMDISMFKNVYNYVFSQVDTSDSGVRSIRMPLSHVLILSVSFCRAAQEYDWE